MILDGKNICKKLSNEKNINNDLLLSINSIVFKELFDWYKKPTSLKAYLKHFGSWFFKNKKTKRRLEIFENVLKFEKNLPEKTKERIFLKIDIYNFILSEYNKYIEEKLKVKHEKYGKENYEAYCLAKKKEKFQKSKKDKLI